MAIVFPGEISAPQKPESLTYAQSGVSSIDPITKSGEISTVTITNYLPLSGGIITGDITFASGESPTTRTIAINPQTDTDGDGNSFVINAGEGNGTGEGGSIELVGGVGGATANGGLVNIRGGDAGAEAGDGGNVELMGGISTEGVNGKVLITDPTNSLSAILDPSNITTDNKTFTFPDVSGTIALESGASGSFTTVDDKTVTVVNGIITSIE
jgi:hypothetical protein